LHASSKEGRDLNLTPTKPKDKLTECTDPRPDEGITRRKHEHLDEGMLRGIHVFRLAEDNNVVWG
jgi:hypothetical protein